MWPCLEAMQTISTFPDPISEGLVSPYIMETTQSMQRNPLSSLTVHCFRQCWIVCVLVVLRHNIEIYELNSVEENRARTVTVINRLPPHFWIPDHILEGDDFPPSPILRPISGFPEPDILPLHRCLCLLQYLEITHDSESRRENYLDMRLTCCDEEFEVTAEDIPWWMRPSTY